MHARQTDGTQRGRQLKGYSAQKISIVLKYLLLKVKLRFKSQHGVRIFYESRNCYGITACNSEYKYQTLHSRLITG